MLQRLIMLALVIALFATSGSATRSDKSSDHEPPTYRGCPTVAKYATPVSAAASYESTTSRDCIR
jgi:hypothetical protein